MVTYIFRRHRCVLNRVAIFLLNVDDDWTNSEEMATAFEIQDGGDRHLEFFRLCISDVIDMFQIEKSTLPVKQLSREMNS